MPPTHALEASLDLISSKKPLTLLSNGFPDRNAYQIMFTYLCYPLGYKICEFFVYRFLVFFST